MFYIYQDSESTYILAETFRGQSFLCGLTLAEAILMMRYINGGVMTGGQQNEVDLLIANNVCPFSS